MSEPESCSFLLVFINHYLTAFGRDRITWLALSTIPRKSYTDVRNIAYALHLLLSVLKRYIVEILPQTNKYELIAGTRYDQVQMTLLQGNENIILSFE